VEEVERRLRAKGARRITALVAKSEEHAPAFWEAVGYANDERIQRHVKTLE
jgi:ribosomal protein S18 acetylase RimI-like enzyme